MSTEDKQPTIADLHELEAWLTAGDIRVRTVSELGTEAATYCSTHKTQHV